MENHTDAVAIVGAGLIGRAWAAVFSRAGWQVRLTDPDGASLTAAPGLIREELHMLAGYGLADDPDGAANRVNAARSLAEALEGVSFVQENGPEIVETKKAIFADLDKIAASHVILSSSTSAILPSLFTE